MTFRKHVFENGLRLITIPMRESPTVTVMVLVEAGSKYETKEISGLSHFLEHLCFKGTARRRRAIDIARELDAIGAQYNAFTSLEFTGYFAKVDPRHFAVALDVVSDLYLNSTFAEEELEKEKGVIIEEINLYQDLPQRHVQDLFLMLLYGDQPAGWNVAGTKETVRAMTRQQFLDYRRRHYVSRAAVVVVAGKVNEDAVIAAVSTAFTAMPTGPKHGKTAVREVQEAPAVNVKFRETDQTHLVLGVRTFDTYHKKLPTLRVLSDVLGGGMSSRLFQKLREQMGVGYYLSASGENFTDHGYFSVATGVDNRRLEEVIAAIIDEFRALRDRELRAEELRKVKDHLIGSLTLSLETSDAVADFFGYQEILRKDVIKTPAAVAADIEAVSAAGVKDLARDIFVNRRLNLALVGPVRDDERIRRVFSL